MIVAKALFVVYLFYFLLAFFSPINVQFKEFYFGFVIVFVLWVCYFLGILVCQEVMRLSRNNGLSVNKIVRCRNPFSGMQKVYGLVAVVCAIYATVFYTGLWPRDVALYTFSSAISSYNQYQIYFQENNLSALSLIKIPAIIFLFVVKILVLYFLYMAIFFFNVKKGVLFWCNFFAVLGSLVYFALARGTSFAFFEMFMICFFFFLLKSGKSLFRFFFSPLFLVVALMALSMLFIYMNNIDSRYVGVQVPECVVEAMCYDSSSFLPSWLGNIFVKLSSYFSFGIYYLSVFSEVSFSGLDSFFFPLSILEPGAHSRHLCFDVIECGAMWSPAIESWILVYGFMGVLVSVFALGFFSFLLFAVFKASTSFVCVGILYMIFLQMVSFPVGHFVGNSSSNVLIVFSLFGVVIYRVFSNKFVLRFRDFDA